MTDKIILNIRHSDDYTDYLFLTSAFTNRRVIPLVDPDPEEIKRLSDRNTKVIRCFRHRTACEASDRPVEYNEMSGALHILSRYYMEDDGTILHQKAETVRMLISEAITEQLMAPKNLGEVYRLNFPLLWRKRHTIYENPQFFYVRSGWCGMLYDHPYPVGVILKTIEEDPANFRLSLRGGCHCSEPPLLIDYPTEYTTDRYYKLYTWCPKCGARREIKAETFWREGICDHSLEIMCAHYDKGQGFSTLSLFDLVDTLRSA